MGESRGRRRDERGSGLLSSVMGVAIVAALIGLAANVALGLWLRSTVDSVAYDAARQAATAPPERDPAEVERVVTHRAARLLGAYGRKVDLRFEHDDASEVVVLRVRAPGVALLPRVLGSGPTVGDIDRRIVVTREHQP